MCAVWLCRCVEELAPSDADLLYDGVDTTGFKVGHLVGI